MNQRTAPFRIYVCHFWAELSTQILMCFFFYSFSLFFALIVNLLYTLFLELYGYWLHCYLLYIFVFVGFDKELEFTTQLHINQYNFTVDSRMRVQLSLSPVDHEKNTVRLNIWFRFIPIKSGNIYNYSHLILSWNGFTLCYN